MNTVAFVTAMAIFKGKSWKGVQREVERVCFCESRLIAPTTLTISLFSFSGRHSPHDQQLETMASDSPHKFHFRPRQSEGHCG